jgi:hypothetical protein
LIQANPQRWDIFGFVENEPPDALWTWTVNRYLSRINVDDHVALWIAGPSYARGVHAVGRKRKSPYRSVFDSRYWVNPQEQGREQWLIDFQLDRSFFSAPMLAGELVHDDRFRRSLILRAPLGGNPFPLSVSEWEAISSRLGTDRSGDMGKIYHQGEETDLSGRSG